MKLMLALVAIVPVLAWSQTTVLNEDFQAGFPSAWTIHNDNNTVNAAVSEYTAAWIVAPDPENPADSVAASTSYFSSPAEANRWMVSPALTLGAYGNYISWKAKSHDPSYPEDYKVMISTSSDLASFTDTLAIVFEENYLWQDYEINLSELGYDNQTVYVAFNLRTYDGFKLYLDDINVRREDPVSVSENQIQAFRLYPNPCTTKLNVSSEEKISKMEVFDALGNKVLISETPELNTSSLVPGIYFLKVFAVSGISTQRFSVQ